MAVQRSRPQVTAMPPPISAWLYDTVELISRSTLPASTEMPPPYSAELLLIVELLTVTSA